MLYAIALDNLKYADIAPFTEYSEMGYHICITIHEYAYYIPKFDDLVSTQVLDEIRQTYDISIIPKELYLLYQVTGQ